MPVVVPKYQEIAADFAEKLVGGEFAVGEKIYARSTLASTYGVSSETARRALAVLADLGVLEVSGGSGAVILSIDKAADFLRSFRNAATVESLKDELLQRIRRQREELDLFAQNVTALADKAEKLRADNPFIPYRVTVPHNSPRLGKTLGELNFWHHTGATVVAIGSGDELHLSPGPHADVQANCVIYYIGTGDCAARVRAFLSPETEILQN